MGSRMMTRYETANKGNSNYSNGAIAGSSGSVDDGGGEANRNVNSGSSCITFEAINLRCRCLLARICLKAPKIDLA